MRILLGFGEGSSAALWKDKLIINWDNEDESFITALDKNTGQTLWKTPRDEKTSWATPLVVEHEGKAQVITAAPEDPLLRRGNGQADLGVQGPYAERDPQPGLSGRRRLPDQRIPGQLTSWRSGWAGRAT